MDGATDFIAQGKPCLPLGCGCGLGVRLFRIQMLVPWGAGCWVIPVIMTFL